MTLETMLLMTFCGLNGLPPQVNRDLDVTCAILLVYHSDMGMHYLPSKLLKCFAQNVNSSKMTGSSDFLPNPKNLRVERAKRLCCFHMCPLLKITPDGKHINDR